MHIEFTFLDNHCVVSFLLLLFSSLSSPSSTCPLCSHWVSPTCLPISTTHTFYATILIKVLPLYEEDWSLRNWCKFSMICLPCNAIISWLPCKTCLPSLASHYDCLWQIYLVESSLYFIFMAFTPLLNGYPPLSSIQPSVAYTLPSPCLNMTDTWNYYAWLG